MEEPGKTYRRTKTAEGEEAKQITNAITKLLFKDSKEMAPKSMNDALEDIDDLGTIHDCILRMILRRNASYTTHE